MSALLVLPRPQLETVGLDAAQPIADWPGLLCAKLFVVEQDVVPDAQGRLVPDPVESARRSRAYLRDAVGL